MSGEERWRTNARFKGAGEVGYPPKSLPNKGEGG
jgi:hypothetical protein